MMKKARFLLAILAAVTLSACAYEPAVEPDSAETTVETSAVVETTAEVAEKSDSEESISLFEQVNEPFVAEQDASEPPEASVEAQSEGTSEASQPPAAESPSEAPAETNHENQPPEAPVVTEPVSTPEPEIPAEPIATPEPTPEVTPEPQPTAPPFDVSAYVSYAKNYGSGIGLSLDSSATACWDDPITANAGCLYLERDIRDRLDWYSASGFTAFWVWSVDAGGGSFQIFIGYA